MYRVTNPFVYIGVVSCSEHCEQSNLQPVKTAVNNEPEERCWWSSSTYNDRTRIEPSYYRYGVSVGRAEVENRNRGRGVMHLVYMSL